MVEFFLSLFAIVAILQNQPQIALSLLTLLVAYLLVEILNGDR